MFNPRPKQQQVLNYSGGWMGVSAVPGSGKTHTLSLLAANIIASDILEDDQEVLIVTLVNSAVENFSARVGGFIQKMNLIPDIGYRVRTMHGLAHDIVRERPDLAGLSDQFTIIDERDSSEILKSLVAGWLRSHPYLADEWIKSDSDSNSTAQKWDQAVVSLAGNFIRKAKDLLLTPQDLSDLLHRRQYSDNLFNACVEIYSAYQRALSYRSAVDFDDLIRLALQTLESDPEFIARLRRRWPIILEDEAQDSSHLQEAILRLLVGQTGGWVRVGDPNQAIYETFTTASPEYLRHFLHEPGVAARDLPDSGRSMHSIIDLANELIRWTADEHPVPELRSALAPPFIQPTPPGDPQPNPPDHPEEIFLYLNKLDPDKEIEIVCKSVKKWLEQNPEKTAAILVPRNERGTKIVEALQKHNIQAVELLRSSVSTRQTADQLAQVIKALTEPAKQRPLVEVFKTWAGKQSEDPEQAKLIESGRALLSTCSHTEDYLWPVPGKDWLAGLVDQGVKPQLIEVFQKFRELVRRWQTATLLPIDQLILTVAQDLFTTPAELALAHKLALSLEQYAAAHPTYRINHFLDELQAVSRNQRKIQGFTDEDTGFDPDEHKGQVVVATIHKAKGLEWDRVYLLSINNYDFPSLQEYDSYIGEKEFIRGNLNLEAEILNRLNALVENNLEDLYLDPGIATREARIEYCAERLRLLFVGITRARGSLVMTWNTGRVRTTGRENQPSIPFVHLHQYWKDIQSDVAA